MIFREEFVVEAPHSEAWRFFSNFPDPIRVLPGLTELRQTEPYCFVGGAKVGIGPFVFHFKGNMNVILVDPQTYRVNISGGAQDQQLGGQFKAIAYTQTLPHGSDCSRVTLEVEVGLGGLLGKLGLFVLKPASHHIIQRYCQLVNAELKQRRIANSRQPRAASKQPQANVV